MAQDAILQGGIRCQHRNRASSLFVRYLPGQSLMPAQKEFCMNLSSVWKGLKAEKKEEKIHPPTENPLAAAGAV